MEFDIRPGIEYARHDGATLLGDLYAPKEDGRHHPVIVAVHGGGWQLGSRDSYRHWGAFLAQRGYALFAAGYRLSKPGEKSYPQAIHDIRAAVQFVKGKGEALKLDAARVALMGDSAGAHVAALVALAGDGPLFAGAYRDDPHAGLATKVKAVIGIYGVYDLFQQWNHDLGPRLRDSIVEKFLGTAPMENRRIFFDASPLSHVTTDNNATAFLLGYGTEDDIVDRHAQSEVFLTALKQARFFVRTVVIPGAGHFWMSDPIEEAGSFTAHLAPRLLRFLAEKL
ncbi:MAG TPA: alpha/beta hydrolase [Stellaceae bacterium]|nr:alpha/beta hydrolase [Stellaceae bacterium]